MKRAFSHTLRVALVDAGMTQQQLADAVGLSLQTVGRHVRGQGEPNVSQLIAYAEVLGVEFRVAPATGLEPVTYRSSHGDAA